MLRETAELLELRSLPVVQNIIVESARYPAKLIITCRLDVLERSVEGPSFTKFTILVEAIVTNTLLLELYLRDTYVNGYVSVPGFAEVRRYRLRL